MVDNDSLRPKAYSYIRMSSDAQISGDSRRRQLALSTEYAKENNLNLVDAPFEDLGTSAFKGLHASSGALSKFIRSVEEGVIEPGSYLLVESLDRLGRDAVIEAMSRFLSLVNAGIVIVTLNDKRVYAKKSINAYELVSSLTLMSGAHDESVNKSRRVAAAWEQKRAVVADEKLTARCPAWLSLDSNKLTFSIIEDKAELVRRIFELCNRGYGYYSISRTLNEEKVPAFRGKNGWHTSSIAKLLSNRSVLGEFSPHKLNDGKRMKLAKLDSYFPRIIDDEVFNEAQANIHNRKVGGGGRLGVSNSNLFSKLAVCEYCSGSMVYLNKGAAPKGGTYLICSNSMRKRGCESAGWRYQHFEISFLRFVEEINLPDLLRTKHKNSKDLGLRRRLLQFAGKEKETNRALEDMIDLYRKTHDSEFVASKIQQLEVDLKLLRSNILEVRNELDIEEKNFHLEQASGEALQKLIERFSASGENFDERLRLSTHLRNIIEKIIVASPKGGLSLLRRKFNMANPRIGTDENRERKASYEFVIADLSCKKAFLVQFKSGKRRFVIPDDLDPSVLKIQIVNDSPHSAPGLAQISYASKLKNN